MTDRLLNAPPVVSPEEWETARQQLLVKEKASTRARDALAAERRRMPWMKVEKNYTFDSPKGKVSLVDLFEGRHQLGDLSRVLRARRVRLARACLSRLLDDGRSGRARFTPPRTRHDFRERLARSAARHRALEGADGLDDAVVYDYRRFRRRLRR